MCILKNLTPRYVSSSRNAIVTHALCDWCLGVIINYETWKFDWVLIFADFRFILDPLKKVLRKIMSCKNKTPEKLLTLVIKISAYWLNCTPCSIFTRNLHQRIIYSASRSLFRWYSEPEKKNVKKLSGRNFIHFESAWSCSADQNSCWIFALQSKLSAFVNPSPVNVLHLKPALYLLGLFYPFCHFSFSVDYYFVFLFFWSFFIVKCDHKAPFVRCNLVIPTWFTCFMPS